MLGSGQKLSRNHSGPMLRFWEAGQSQFNSTSFSEVRGAHLGEVSHSFTWRKKLARPLLTHSLFSQSQDPALCRFSLGV